MAATKREALDWLTQPADASGECDRCHKEDLPLYQLPQELDAEPDAGWMYCPACFRALLKRKSPVSPTD